jgi:hypothetical protein
MCLDRIRRFIRGNKREDVNVLLKSLEVTAQAGKVEVIIADLPHIVDVVTKVLGEVHKLQKTTRRDVIYAIAISIIGVSVSILIAWLQHIKWL